MQEQQRLLADFVQSYHCLVHKYLINLSGGMALSHSKRREEVVRIGLIDVPYVESMHYLSEEEQGTVNVVESLLVHGHSFDTPSEENFTDQEESLAEYQFVQPRRKQHNQMPINHVISTQMHCQGDIFTNLNEHHNQEDIFKQMKETAHFGLDTVQNTIAQCKNISTEKKVMKKLMYNSSEKENNNNNGQSAKQTMLRKIREQQSRKQIVQSLREDKLFIRNLITEERKKN